MHMAIAVISLVSIHKIHTIHRRLVDFQIHSRGSTRFSRVPAEAQRSLRMHKSVT